jgi:uracil-DNA glycosylase
MSTIAGNDLEQLQAHLELQKKLKNPGVTRKKINKNETMNKIREELGDCQRCPLAKTRTNLVFGAGDPDARLMFVGEAPGRDEDLKGIPFVGRAGQLLTKIIQAINMTRS